MKDGTTGRYWCYDCFLVEQRKKQPSGMMMRCPHCNKDYPPLRMVKHQEVYWCENCVAERLNKGKKRSSIIATPSASGATPGGSAVGATVAVAPARPGKSAAPTSDSPARPVLIVAALVVAVVGAILWYTFLL